MERNNGISERALLKSVRRFVLLLVLGVATLQFSESRPVEIRVSNYGNDSSECLKNSSYPCQSLFYAMYNINNRHDCKVVLESGVHSLNQILRMNEMVNFQLVGDQSSVVKPIINCTETNTGLYFNRSYNMHFEYFELENCGAWFPSTSWQNGTRLDLRTAFHLTECTNASMRNVGIKNSVGMGAVYYDVSGKVLFENVHFVGNRHRGPFPKNARGRTSGGGIYVEFRRSFDRSGSDVRGDFRTGSDMDGNKFNSNSRYRFQDCKFISNVAEYQNSTISYSGAEEFFSFGRGGGLSYIAQGKSKGNELNVNNCHFFGNKALWGAGIFVEFDDESSSQQISIRDSKFFNNTATMAGGGVRIGVNAYNAIGTIRVNILRSVFGYNAAKIGGAFSQYRPSNDGREEDKVIVNGCCFENNTARIATNIHLQHLNLLLVNSSILNDKRNFEPKDDNIPRQGALYGYSSNITLKGENLIAGNRFTAFVLDSCLVFVYDSCTFRYNKGKQGGAMSLYSHSSVRMTNGSKMFMQHNEATSKGGAMFIETPTHMQNKITSTELKIYKCFLKFGDDYNIHSNANNFNAKIYFKGNKAPGEQDGKAVWATTLTWCRENNEGKYNNTVLNTWKTVDYDGDDPLNSVATSPTHIETDEKEWDAYPGISFQPKINLRDENWNRISATVQIKINPLKGAVKVPYSYIIVENTADVTLVGELGAKYSVTLETQSRYSVSKYIGQRQLFKNCPPGFLYNSKTQQCECLGTADGVTLCNKQTKSVSVLPGRWGNPIGGKNFLKHSCPQHYCKVCNRSGIGCLYKEGNQCAEGRKQDSLLCGKCQKGLSVEFGAEKCRKCDNKAKGLLIIVFMLCITVFVLAVMIVNLDTYSSYLNAFFYSYQIIPLITQDIVFDPVFSFIISVSNLRGFGMVQTGLCLGLTIDNMQKFMLNYLVPIFMIVVMVSIGALSYCFNGAIQYRLFNKNTGFRAFVFISVFAYSDFTRITFQVLKPVSIEGNLKAYYAAHMKYFGRDHALFASFALIVLAFIVIGFPLALIFSHLITANSKFVKLKGIFDTFNEPFLEKYGIFPAYYFLTRLVILLLDVTIEERALHRVFIGIVCILVVYVFTLAQPYKSKHMNYHDSLLLTNIAFIALINIATGETYATGEREGLRTAAKVLAYIPFICLMSRAGYWLVIKVRQWRNTKAGRTNSGRPILAHPRVPRRVMENYDDSKGEYRRFQDS